MKKRKESVHSCFFIDGIILSTKDKDVVYNDYNKSCKVFNKKKNKNVLANVPIIRGIVKSFNYLVLNIKALEYSLLNVDTTIKQEDIINNKEKKILKLLKINVAQLLFFIALIISFVFCLMFFILAPSVIASIFYHFIPNDIFASILEGLFRLIIFSLYLKLTGNIPEIKNIEMYHAAEHKVMNCFKKDKELTLQNIKEESMFLKNCSTSNMYKLAMLITFYFSIFSFDSIYLVNFVMRILLFPVILGAAYEFKFIFEDNNLKTNSLEKMIQWFFLQEPTDEIIENVTNAFNELNTNKGD